MRIYPPLNAEHPLIGRPCARCGLAFEHLDRTALAPTGGSEQAEHPLFFVRVGARNVPCEPVHASCLKPYELEDAES